MEEPEVAAAAPPYEAVPPSPPPTVSAGGLAENVAAALAYVTIIPAILFLILEPYNKSSFIRFNCFQCILLAVIGFALHFLIVIPLLGLLVVLFGDLCLFVAWLFCILKAYQGVKFKLPLIGDFAENFAK